MEKLHWLKVMQINIVIMFCYLVLWKANIVVDLFLNVLIKIIEMFLNPMHMSEVQSRWKIVFDYEIPAGYITN